MSLDRAIEAAAEALFQNDEAGHAYGRYDLARVAVEAAAPYLLPEDPWEAGNLRERAEQAEAEVKTAIEWVGEVLIQRNDERALADQLSEALRDMARPGSAMFQERIRKANDALAKWEEARRES